jgi:hypothetical protein
MTELIPFLQMMYKDPEVIADALNTSFLIITGNLTLHWDVRSDVVPFFKGALPHFLENSLALRPLKPLKMRYKL